jgi:signal transduction histidine kinase
MSQRAANVPGQTVLVGCAGIAFAFIVSTLIAQRTSGDIEGEALSISFAVGPNIEALSGVRTELRHLQALVLQRLELGGKRPAAASDKIGQVRRELDARLSLCVVQRSDEAVLFARFQEALRRFDLAAERALTMARSGVDRASLVKTEAELQSLADDASERGGALITMEVERARGAAMQIERLRQKSNRAALQLDALCGAGAAVVAALVFRSQRRFLRLQHEHEAVLRRRAEELDQFASRVAHDILGPMGSVSMALTVAERPAVSAESKAAALTRGHASIGRVQRLVDGLLDFARAGAAPHGATAELQTVLPGLAEEIQSEAQRARVDLEVDKLPNCTVSCSPGALLSVLGNLLRNSIKYMGDSETRHVSLRVQAGRGRVYFEVQDTGPGIAAELSERIFQPYVRAGLPGQPGIGLGLATVKRLVEAHGGRVGVRSVVAGGSLFWFELPRAADPDSTAKGKSPLTSLQSLRRA